MRHFSPSALTSSLDGFGIQHLSTGTFFRQYLTQTYKPKPTTRARRGGRHAGVGKNTTREPCDTRWLWRKWKNSSKIATGLILFTTRPTLKELEIASSSGTETERDQETLPVTSARPKTPFIRKSTFIPPKHRNSSVDTYYRLVERDTSDLYNLTKTQHTELETLNNDNSIVIQSADKGGALVILDKDAYNQAIVKQLRSYTFYQKLHGNPVTELKTKYTDVSVTF